ncbi:hypothetical protein SARC_01895 [Sphaeroforma arctica JP610]|uniref:Bestrophin homolog n=1 Tax=Sphaeroforma arctica JP610 TaxID=667725 RepID=A0A0L0GAL6_9EUKA|nr:hypothetical protein SARC_01895 [Sphaeroforma arctica JP610]KNC85949.1 hypothetical protein SARC_01895 [Sphaeroforma arctica JP610]|eukprot:XP_014159851.1 hypothetical protein SARC_01895 [Sphaeroforma arctica JP610]
MISHPKLAVAYENSSPERGVNFSSGFVKIITETGLLLTLLLAFRVTSAFTLWDTGVRSCGALSDGARCITGQLLSYTTIENPADMKATMDRTHQYLVLFLSLIYKHVQGDDCHFDLAELELITERSGDLDVRFAQDIDYQVNRLSENLQTILKVAFTPIPFSYAQLLKHMIFLYTSIAPWSYADDLRWVAPFVAFLVAMIFYGCEEIAIEVEGPFGLDENDIDLLSRSRQLDAALSEYIMLNMKDVLNSCTVDHLSNALDFHCNELISLERRISSSSLCATSKSVLIREHFAVGRFYRD